MRTFFKNLVLVGLAASISFAAPIVISSTGVGAASAGTTDPNWTITSPSGRTTQAFRTNLLGGSFPLVNFWNGTGTSSFFISPRAFYDGGTGTNDTGGTYVFSTTFDLTGLDPASVALAFRVLADDNFLGYQLNGGSLTNPISNPGTQNFSNPFSITGNFNSGVNTLSFVVQNTGNQSSTNPVGLRAEVTSATANVQQTPTIPEPGTVTLLGVGFAAIVAARLRQRK